MMARRQDEIAVLFVALLCVSCAVSPEIQQQRQAVEDEIESILNAPLDEGQFGETKRCLTDREYRNFRAIDDRRILFEGRRDELWLNTLRMRCPDLRNSQVLQMRSTFQLGRICDMDTFVAGDWFAWPWYRRWPWYWGRPWGDGIQCSLGKFQPITASQVEAIEKVLEPN